MERLTVNLTATPHALHFMRLAIEFHMLRYAFTPEQRAEVTRMLDELRDQIRHLEATGE